MYHGLDHVGPAWKGNTRFMTNISPTIARNIPTAVRIANQTRRTVPVRIATAINILLLAGYVKEFLLNTGD